MDPEKILRGKRVLIVDDEQDVLEFLTELLDMLKRLRSCWRKIFITRQFWTLWE